MSELPRKRNIAKCTKTKVLKKSSLRKQILKNPVVIMRYDRSKNYSEEIAIHFPDNTVVSHRELPKERNPDLISIYFQNLKITWRKDLKKGAIFDKNGIFSASFDKYDIKNLYSKIGHLIKEIK